MTLRDKSRKGKKDKLAKGHKPPFRTDPRSESNVDLLGTVTDPAPSSDLTEGQHLEEVYGLREHGRCSRLGVPLQLTLPAPDGVADGWGWDPTMRRRMQILVVLVSLFLGAPIYGQNVNTCGMKTDDGKWKMVPCNGISVGLPKVFDNRTLTLQLEKLKQQLNQQQTQNGVIDLKSVAAALNNLQGLSQRETSTALSVTGSPTPATTLTNTLNTGNVDASGNPLPNTTTTQNQTTNSSVTPTAPAFDSFATLPAGFNPTFGSSASDLLSDQMNLSYQIVNLQMLLDRALSDRIYPQDSGGGTRLQTVLGFNVSLDPPRTANDAVAVVEVTLKSDPGGDISLVALMPQEKTYNAAALSSKSNAYSGAAMAGAFQVSGGVRKRSQVFYLYKDVDTLSYERMTPDGSIIFGWMFRPVLGRRSVAPGFKQLFAVFALPRTDCIDPAKDDSCAVKVTPTVRTYWKKYDRNTQTGFRGAEANRARDAWYGLSLGLAKPQLFSHAGYQNYREYGTVRVGATGEYQRQLTPTVTKIEWRPTGAKTTTISVKGNNFFTDTQVLLGDTKYSEAAGNMAIKSDQSFELASTLDQVASGSGVIEGRYGLSTPLVNAGPANCVDVCAYGVEIDPDHTPTITQAMGGSRRLTVTLRAIPSPKSKADAKNAAEKAALLNLAVTNLAGLSNVSLTGGSADSLFKTTQMPVLSVNGTSISFPYDIVNCTDQTESLRCSIKTSLNETRIQISANVSDTLLTDTSASVIKIAWPFYDSTKWSTSISYSPPDAQFSVARVSDTSFVLSRINSLAFVPTDAKPKHCWTLIATDKPLPFGTDDCAPPPAAAPKPAASKPAAPTLAPTPKPGPAPKPGQLPVPAPAKATPAKKQDPPAQPKATRIGPADEPAYSFLFTFPAKLPSKAILVATDGSIYHIEIPDSTDKKDTATKITTLQQYDSAWIDITYPTNKVPYLVKTNGIKLNWRIDLPDPKATPAVATAGKTTDKTMHVEITRSQTAKPGLLDVVVFDKTDAQIAKVQVRITCTLCGDGGDK